MGIKFIGGCCGFEAYHIRAVAEEVIMSSTIYRPCRKLVFFQLSKERGHPPPIGEEYGTWVDGLKLHTKPWVRAR